jgi:ABC-2 type transport system permease protein
MKKLLVIVGKELAVELTDSTLLLAIALPLVIAALVQLGFGNIVLDSGIPDVSVSVGIVNQDHGSSWGNLGEIFELVLIPDSQTIPLPSDWYLDLFTIVPLDSECEARRLVEREKLVAVLVIPPDFSEALIAERAEVKVFVNDRYIFRGAAFRSAVETLANLISTGEITLRNAIEGLSHNPRGRQLLNYGQLDDVLADLALTAAMPESNPIQLQRGDPVAGSTQIELARYLAATITIMFTGFWNMRVCATLLQEKAQGTLQRMQITPTAPGIILVGKSLGIYLSSVIQLVVLVASMAILQMLLKTGARPIDLLGLSLLVLVLPFVTTGFGLVVAGLSSSYARATNHGRAVMMIMGLIGGIFFPVALFPESVQFLSYFTYHYWAMQGYLKLAHGGNIAEILPYSLAIVLMGLLFFILGNWIIKRRIGVV